MTKILLVEDNARLLRSMAFLLTIAGFEVAAVNSKPPRGWDPEAPITRLQFS